MYSISFFALLMLSSTNFLANGQERSQICPVDDYECIKKYFKYQTTCDPDVYGIVLDTFKITFTVVELWSYDTSLIDLYAEIINLDSCYVSEFDLLSKPEAVVLTLDCKELVISSNRTAIRHKYGKLDEMYRYYITIRYPFIRMVTIFGITNGFMSACEAYTYTEILKKTSFTVKANDAKSKEFIKKDIIFKEDSRPFVDVETLSPAWGATLTNTWLNLKICNFGCSIAAQYTPFGLSIRTGISESSGAPKYTYY